VIFPYDRFVGVGSLHFLGSTRGVLPNGPNGMPAFNTLSKTVFSDAVMEPAASYNYTLELQGVSSNVTCAYGIDNPIIYTTVAPNVWQFSGSCPTGQDVLTTPYQVTPSNYTLGFWACQTGQSVDSYTLYLRGTNLLATNVGNITCTVSPNQPAVLPLTYTRRLDAFTTKNPISTSPTTSTELFSSAVKGLGDVIWKGQGPVTNWVSDMVIGFGAQFLNLQLDSQDEGYLRLYEAMIQGILDYEVRLFYYLSS
jgi:hypothetical protein